MIIDKKVSVKMNSKHINKYINLGYQCLVGEYVDILIEHLPRYSKCEINVKCQNCYKENKVLYVNYCKQIETQYEYRCKICGRQQAKKTCIDRYGVDNPTKSKQISNKISLTYKEKTIEQKNEILVKQKMTFFNNYGGWFVNTNEYKFKIKETSIERYGVDDYRSSNSFKDKVKDTVFKRYGVHNVSQAACSYNKSWFGNKINGLHIYTNLTYQGTYELDFLNKYHSKVNIEKLVPIRYELYGNIHYYHPDFYLPDFNLIVEIKSSYTYNYDIEKNIAKKNYCIKSGYNFLFIIDKDYQEFDTILLSLLNE